MVTGASGLPRNRSGTGPATARSARVGFSMGSGLLSSDSGSPVVEGSAPAAELDVPVVSVEASSPAAGPPGPPAPQPVSSSTAAERTAAPRMLRKPEKPVMLSLS